MRKAVFLHRLAQQIDVIAGPATAASLGQQQRRALQIVFAAFQSVKQLANHQQRRITCVVMYVLQTSLRHAVAGIFQKLHIVALPPQNAANQLKMHRQHLRHQNGVVPLHIRRELPQRHFMLPQGHFHLLTLRLIEQPLPKIVERLNQAVQMCL